MSTKTLISFDYAIKYLLKHKGDYDIVEGFISALLEEQGYGPVKITALLDSETNKEQQLLKKSIADLIVEDVEGQKYIVEIERQFTTQFIHKACFNTSRLIVDSIGSSEDYTTIKKVFHISLLYFTWGNMSKPLYHGQTIIREVETKEPLEVHLADLGGRIYDASHIFPEYILVSIPLFDDTIRKELDEWLYVMKHSEVRDDFKSPYMKKVAERLNILTMDAYEKDEYYRYIKETLTQRDTISAAEEKGQARGVQQGMQQGIQYEKLEIAKNMLRKGYQADTVLDLTGLSKEELERLRKEAK
jgi:predicted transposase/invertase (TIGR01784 family)